LTIQNTVTIDQLIADNREGLGLEIMVGTGLEREIAIPRIQKPGLALTGYTEQLHPQRMLVLGGTEIDYLCSVTPSELVIGIDTVMAAEPACIVVTRGLEPPRVLTEACAREGVPLLVTRMPSAEFIGEVTIYLEDQMAPSTSTHGVLLDVLGVGILLLGKSGIGKSEIALDLVVRGHRLVADDIVDIRKKSNLVYGSGSRLIRHHMEIRGLGIINIKDLFGISSVREHKKIELVIELVEWDASEEYDRLGLDELHYKVLEVAIPKLRLPVRPGKTMATIIEVAARNHLLKLQGHHSAREFKERLDRAMEEARAKSYDIDLIE
jgi:HPr kinase/phosphorylase